MSRFEKDFIQVISPLSEEDNESNHLFLFRPKPRPTLEEQLKDWESIFPNAKEIKIVSLTPQQASAIRCPACGELVLNNWELSLD